MYQRKKCQGIKIIKGKSRQQRIGHFHFGNSIFGIFAALFKRLALKKKKNTPTVSVHPNRSANFKAAPSIYCLLEEERQKGNVKQGKLWF